MGHLLADILQVGLAASAAAAFVLAGIGLLAGRLDLPAGIGLMSIGMAALSILLGIRD
jgi:hypothetical protein